MYRPVLLIGMALGGLADATGDVGASHWKAIAAQIEASLPAHEARLRPGASIAEIDAAEAKLGYALPQSVVEVMTLNDGETVESDGLFGTWRLLPLQEQLAEIDGSLNDSRFSKGQFHPLLLSGGGDYYGIEPSTGKMWAWNHELGMVEVAWPSFGAFLEDFLQKWKRGEFLAVPEFDGLVARDEL